MHAASRSTVLSRLYRVHQRSVSSSSAVAAGAFVTRPRKRSQPQTSKPWSQTGKQRQGTDKSRNKTRELTSTGLPKLRPYDLTQRLSKKCEEGKLDEAYEELLRMPRDAMDVITWNSIITYSMKAARYSMAFKVFNEMKRRSFTPNVRTYQALLTGFAVIKDWDGRSVTRIALEKVYASYQAYSAKIRAEEPDRMEKEISVIPVNQYLRCLHNMGEFQKMWDIFNALPADGPGAANEYTYTMILSRLAQRQAPPDNKLSDSPDSPELATDVPLREMSENEQKTYQRSASDTLLVWRMMLRSVQRRSDLKLDDLTLTFTLHNLLRSPLNEHFEFARGLIAEYLGLPPDGNEVKKSEFALSGHALHTILSSLIASKRYDSCLHYGALAMHTRSLRKILDIGHMNDILAAHAALARPMAAHPSGSTPYSQKALQVIDWMLAAEHDHLGFGAKPIIPRIDSYASALRACWGTIDWTTACTLFERMTGLRADSFLDDASSSVPAHLRTPGRVVSPDAECLANIMRTALATNSVATRQALRMVAQFGASYLTHPTQRTPAHQIRSAESLATLTIRGIQLDQSKKLGDIGTRLRTACVVFIRSLGKRYWSGEHQSSDSQSADAKLARRVRHSIQPGDDNDEFINAAARLRQQQAGERRDKIEIPFEKFENM